MSCASKVPPSQPLSPQIIVKTEFKYPDVPAEHLLPCPIEPSAPNPETATDKEFGIWTEQLRVAGGDCRGESQWWHDYAKSWPK